eukprot:6439584-Prorocentrum_lima.AAC.1
MSRRPRGMGDAIHTWGRDTRYGPCRIGDCRTVVNHPHHHHRQHHQRHRHAITEESYENKGR